MKRQRTNTLAQAKEAEFASTQWSVVLSAAASQSEESRKALTQLCEKYWYPLYRYVRRSVHDVNEAQDLTQAFFSHLLDKEAIARATPERGRFRDFLLASLKNFLANQWQKQRAEKRGGGRRTLSLDFAQAESRIQAEPFHELTPDKLFERKWVLTLLDKVLERLRRELVDAGKEQYFDHLGRALTGEMTNDGYERAGELLEITPAAAKQAAYRMRKRYREMFRQEVASTTCDQDEVEDEMRRLLNSLNS